MARHVACKTTGSQNRAAARVWWQPAPGGTTRAWWHATSPNPQPRAAVGSMAAACTGQPQTRCITPYLCYVRPLRSIVQFVLSAFLPVAKSFAPTVLRRTDTMLPHSTICTARPPASVHQVPQSSSFRPPNTSHDLTLPVSQPYPVPCFAHPCTTLTTLTACTALQPHGKPPCSPPNPNKDKVLTQEAMHLRVG